MSTLSSLIRAQMEAGRFRSMLLEHCLQWRDHPTEYVLQNSARHLADEGKTAELFEMLTDDHFRELKSQRIGWNALRADVSRGLDAFSRLEPNLFRYLQLLFLGQSDLGKTTASSFQRQRCQDYLKFLQLDTPLASRESSGVHKVLNELFPVTVFPLYFKKGQKGGRRMRVSLTRYELGVWRCNCGLVEGQERRYQYSCQCRKVSGNGPLELAPARCEGCMSPIGYLKCESCQTRVSLDVLWRARAGNLHPKDWRLPLKVVLLAEFADGSRQSREMTLAELPLMLGLQENNGTVFFNVPVFWLHAGAGDAGDFYVFKESIRYEDHVGLLPALEAVLNEELLNLGPWGYKREIRRCFAAEQQEPLDTGGFAARLGWVTDRVWRPPEVIKDVNRGVECQVGTSRQLRHAMAVLVQRLTKPDALSASFVANYSVALGGSDVLAANPGEGELVAQRRQSQLGEDGIVRVGASVQSGDVLVGIERARKLELYKMFGGGDTSLRMPQGVRGRVLAIDISVSKRWKGGKIGSGPGRTVRSVPQDMLRKDDRAQITVSVAVEQSVQVGDVLYDENEGRAVLCRVASETAIVKMCDGELAPDLLVAADHPWVRGEAGTLKRILVSVKPEELLGQSVVARGVGPYKMNSSRPMQDDPGKATPFLEARHLDWLLASGATEAARELLSYHSDCMIWRKWFSAGLCTGKGDRSSKPLSFAGDLTRSPSETIRHVGFLLRGLGIKVTLENSYPTQFRFGLLSDEDIVMDAAGEITPTNGLFSDVVFGDKESAACFCEKEQKGVCGRCGVEAIAGARRRQSMGYIRLYEPVVHPLFLTTLSDHLGSVLHLNPTDIKAVVGCSKRMRVDDQNPSDVQFWSEEKLEEKVPSDNDVPGIHYFEGSEAAKRLLALSGDARQWARVWMAVIPVIPPDRRPTTGDLNVLYETLVASEDSRHPSAQYRRSRGATERNVTALFDNERAGRPRRTWNGRILKSLAGELTDMAGSEPTLLDGLLSRPVDFSASTRLVCGDCANIDSMLLPEGVAWELMEPLIMHELGTGRQRRSPQPEWWQTDSALVRERHETARRALRVACEQSVFLLGLPYGPWPLVALHPRLSSALAVTVHQDLLDRVGWDNLGAFVALFQLLTRKAKREAWDKLRPSQLSNCLPVKTTLTRLRKEKPRSSFNVDREKVAGEFARRAFEGACFPLTIYDSLLMCMGDVPR